MTPQTSHVLDSAGRDLLFHQARTHRAWLDRKVSPETLHEILDLMKFAPTSSNTNPFRVVFLVSAEAKECLKPCLDATNVERTMRAPVTAILAYDLNFFELNDRLNPGRPAFRERMIANPEAARNVALQGGTLQAAYFFLAARSVGLDCGPMAGFRNAEVDAEFFREGSELASWRSNILCNLGYGDPSQLKPRADRPTLEEVSRTL